MYGRRAEWQHRERAREGGGEREPAHQELGDVRRHARLWHVLEPGVQHQLLVRRQKLQQRVHLRATRRKARHTLSSPACLRAATRRLCPAWSAPHAKVCAAVRASRRIEIQLLGGAMLLGGAARFLQATGGLDGLASWGRTRPQLAAREERECERAWWPALAWGQ